MHAALPAPTLVQVARALAIGTASVDDLRTSFAASTLYLERAEHGFNALGAPGHGVVPAFTSTEQLAIARGPVPWFSLPGAELLTLLPAGYDIVLDIGGATPLRLRRVGGHLEAVTVVDGGTGTAYVPNRPTRPGRPTPPGQTEPAEGPERPERSDLRGHPAGHTAGLLAAVGEAAAGLRYGRPHDLPLRSGRRRVVGWDTWRRRSRSRDLGRVSVDLVGTATRAGIGAAAAWRAWRRTALGVFGHDGEPRWNCTAVGAAPSRGRSGERGVTAPLRDGRSDRVEVWRTNLHTPPRSGRRSRVWEGAGPNPLQRATVATSLPTGEQEVRGVVLRSGPPEAEEQQSDPGRSR